MTTTDLTTITLAKGSHHNPARGMCLLEAVAYVSGEEFNDHPPCVSPILSAYGRSLSDALPDDKRQLLVPFIPRLIGTSGDGKDQARGLMAVDWLIRTYTPTWLRSAGLDEAAVSLEALSRQASWDDVKTAVPVVQAAKRTAWSADWSAAPGAGDAAARYAIRYAIRYADEDVAWHAVEDAAGIAGYAAGIADKARLQPTIDALQDSAIELFDRLIVAAARDE